MRFLAFSDVHAHPFTFGSTYVPFPGLPGLHNSRLVDTCKAMIEVATYAHEHGIGTVLFGGDLFHTRQAVKTSAYYLVHHTIKTYFSDNGLDLIMIPGNHDYADRTGEVHSLSTLRYLDCVRVGDAVDCLWSEDGPGSVYTVPYVDDVKQARTNLQAAALRATADTWAKVLLAHLGTEGAVVGSDFVMISDQDITVDDIPLGSFDLCLFGHYHEHQVIAQNAYYIGALTQHNWGDAGGKRGFLDVTITEGTHKVTRIETQAPKFIVCKTLDEVRNTRPVDFVSYRTTEILTDAQQLELRTISPGIRIEPVKQTAPGVVLDTTHMNANSALKPWVETNAGDLDQVRLLRLGESLLSEGQGYALQED